MSYNDFVDNVRRQAGLDSIDKAERITAAALETLGERVYRSEREDLGSQLPKQLREHLFKRLDTEPFELEEFYNRVSSRADVGYPTAVELSRIVMGVLQKAVSEGEMEDVLSQLPNNFRELFGEEPEGPLSPTVG
jgi:uncharacterized protein (DUF2267 family)